MDLITLRIFAPLIAALLTATTQPLFAECALEYYGVDLGHRLNVSLSPNLAVDISPEEEAVQLSVRNGNKITHQSTVESFWDDEIDRVVPRIQVFDVNDDGIKELLIGTGRGMVNTYYDMLIFNADGNLQGSVNVSDPEFCTTDHGFLSWYRSGPRGVNVYWAIDASGIPYEQITQTIVDSVTSHRVVYAEDGTITTQSIVPGDLDILAPSVRVTAAVAANGEGAAVYASTDGEHEIARIPAGTLLVLIGADDTYSLLLVEYGQGKHGWIVLEDVAYD